MPPSQLKRLKASLREQGLVGPQQSKKQKKQNAQNGVNKDKRTSRKVALEGIREQFNPFEFKTPGGKAPKFEVTTMERKKIGVTRPGLKKSQEQELRNAEINSEFYNRNKVGGIVDKRFGENDTKMAPEDKMLERFARAQQKGNGSAFDLEDDEDMSLELTHGGKSLSLNGPEIKDDFAENLSQLSDAEDHPSDDDDRRARKRNREDMEDEEKDIPERKKSKQEVMKELIAKSKLHKYERQAAKDDDDDLREELDAEMSKIHAMLRGIPAKPKIAAPAQVTGMNPERAALMHGNEKKKIEKDYDMRLRQLAQDQRSKPTEKSKTEEQIIAERAQKLKELEAKRLRRMEGVLDSDDEDVKNVQNEEEEDFGFGSGIKPTAIEMGFDDEDDFLIDDDLVASDSELEDDSGSESSGEDEHPADEEDEEFVKGLLTKEEAERPEFLTGANAPIEEAELPAKNGVNGDLPFTFECPQTHEELLEVTKKIHVLDLPEIVKRIRTQYNLTLKSENRGKLGQFAVSLVDHISYLANQPKRPPFAVIETVTRHIHSLAKTFPVETANAFRRHLEDISKNRPLALTPGDLVIFTAIGTIFPTSDHFHQVVTPALLSMARYLGLKLPQTLSDYATGTYLSTLCLQYQKLAKRYVPEVMNFIENTLCILAPKKISKSLGNFPVHEPKTSMRITEIPKSTRKLQLYDCLDQERSREEESGLAIAIVEADINLLSAAAELWIEKAAFTEIFEPVSNILKHLTGKACQSKLPSSTQTLLTKLTPTLNTYLRTAHLARRPLELHHHRPLAIKMSIPKFEESFNPDRHYDPDKERTEAAKLKKEFKREHKGAVRELKKDARLTATVKLKEKREKDEAYERKYKKIIAEIQSEEGREGKEYEREKEWRKKGRK